MPRQKEIDFELALNKFRPPFDPRYIYLFSGHMIDAPERATPRFPPAKEPIAAYAITKKLDELDAGSKDLALCGGACGGDLLFAEACLKLGIRLQIRIPFDEPIFLKNSVTFAGRNWRDRYFAVKSNKLTNLLVMPEELGPTPEDANPYERSNLWQLYT
ncbi:MAG: tetratricopeptide repeat protein, partial [Nitrospirae bacterium]|nr:tetratricopeptide repeat protein [Nitrospirota bacterium]